MLRTLVLALVGTFVLSGNAQTAATAGVANGSGTLVVAGTDKVFVPRGFTSIAVLYPSMYADIMCESMKANERTMLVAAQATFVKDGATQFRAMKDKWFANTVRFQVSQGALVYEHDHQFKTYTSMAASVIEAARKSGLVVIVSMQTEGRGCTPEIAPDTLQKLPDAETEKAWSQILGMLHLDRGYMLEIFNEPDSRADCNHTKTGKEFQAKRGPLHWDGWKHGCGRGKNEGMLTLGEYVRKLAPQNVLIYDMDRNAESAEQAGDFKLPPNAIFAVHPYVFVDGPSGWDTRFGDTYAKGNNLITTEWNSLGSCDAAKDPQGKIARELVLDYLPKRHAGMILFSWDGVLGGELVDLKTFAPRDSTKKCAANIGGAVGMELFQQQSGGDWKR